MIQFYKPNSKNTGCAFGFRIGSKSKQNNEDLCVYLTAVKQHSWNDKTKNGSFAENAKDPDKSVIIKFNEVELGGFIYAIRNYEKYNLFHSFEDNKTSISFGPYTKQNGDKAFSFSVIRNSANKFGMGVEMSEAYLLAEFFEYALQSIFARRSNLQ